jgi:hypothetical protein
MGGGWGKLTVEEGKNGGGPTQSGNGRWPRVLGSDEMGSRAEVVTDEVPLGADSRLHVEGNRRELAWRC